MPRRFHILATNEIYHVFNRSIGKEDILSSIRNLHHLFDLINYYQFPQNIRYSQYKILTKDYKKTYEENFKKQNLLVEIYSFAFMPNHYHFLLKQLSDNGIRTFIRIIQDSFAKYFNLKNDRNGGLFQSSFKAKRVETDEEFLHISRYIHLNPVSSFLIEYEELAHYPYTSFPYYLDTNQKSFLNTREILGRFKKEEDYIRFVADQADYQKQLAAIKHLLVD